MEDLQFGPYIRQLRQESNTPLRKLAAAQDIDPSTLSKIERLERQATPSMVPILAKYFSLDFKELQVRFWTDRILVELR